MLLAVSGYMAHLRALASVTAAQSRVELAERLAHQADDLLTDGVASKIDVSRAQVRLQEEQQRLIDAQSDSARAAARIDDAFFGRTENTVATGLQRSRLAEQAIVLRNPSTPWRVAWTTVLQGQRPVRSLFDSPELLRRGRRGLTIPLAILLIPNTTVASRTKDREKVIRELGAPICPNSRGDAPPLPAPLYPTIPGSFFAGVQVVRTALEHHSAAGKQ